MRWTIQNTTDGGLVTLYRIETGLVRLFLASSRKQPKKEVFIALSVKKALNNARRTSFIALMPQLIPGLLYVIVITVVFTVVLITATAASLLTQARAIVRKRSIGPVLSQSNTKKVAALRPTFATLGTLVNVKDETINRLLTTFKRPAELRLYDEFFYVRPLFSSSAYLIPLKETLNISLVNKTLIITFQHDDHNIALRCKSRNRAKWFDALNRRIPDHK